MTTRRDFLKALTMAPLLLGSRAPLAEVVKMSTQTVFPVNSDRVSLSQWSFHREILGDSKANHPEFIRLLHNEPNQVLQGSLDPADIVLLARQLKVNKVDLVNILFFGYAMNKPWLDKLIDKAHSNEVSFQVLMCDETGSLGSSKALLRQKSLDAHMPWLETAAYLGCKQLRVNAYGDGSYLQQLHHCAESLSVLASRGESMGIEILVENHGFASNNGAWLAMLMEQTNHPNLGVFTDLDNFFMGGWGIQPQRNYDRTQGLLDLAPYTRGVSVKAHDFDKQGNETTIDYSHCFNIFEQQHFKGCYSAEFEGNRMSEMAGTKATVAAIQGLLKT
jgi:sugar phosphate isomerase/epimerase